MKGPIEGPFHADTYYELMPHGVAPQQSSTSFRSVLQRYGFDEYEKPAIWSIEGKITENIVLSIS